MAEIPDRVTTTRLNNKTCPRCGVEVDRARNYAGKKQPTAGDVGVCMRCGGIHVFDNRKSVRLPTKEELRRLQADPRLWPQIKRLTRLILEFNRARMRDRN